MSQLDFTDSTEVSIRLLDKTYQIRCAAHEQDDLFKAAKFLDAELRKTRETGIVGIERLSLMTALNLAGDFLHLHEQKEKNMKQINEKIKDLQFRVDEVLTSTEQLELE